jgi:hypothetical protein
MIYTELTEQDQGDLVRERVAFLETQHCRLAVQLRDATTAAECAGLQRQMADIEARHAVHVGDAPGDGPASSTAAAVEKAARLSG